MSRLLGRYCVLLLVIGIVAGFRPAYGADKWVSIRSKNFLLVGNASESSIRRTGRDLEEFRAGFALLFPAIDRQAPPPITVVVFKDDASFRPFKPLYQGKPASIGGFFQAASDVNFIALAADIRTPHVIYHEFVHSLTKDTIALPPWASEGLAEFYGMFEVESNGKEMLLGRPMVDHIETLRNTFLSVETLFNVNHDSAFYNEETKQGIFYAESWAVMHYLMLGENQQYRPQLAKFLALVGSGKAVDESFREAFQRDYRAFEKELQTYVGRFSFPVIRFKLNNKIDFDREMQVSPLTDAQAQYYLGDLLFRIGRLDTAQTYLDKAIALEPDFGPSYESLGMLKARQDKHEEALQLLTKAVQLDSKNYMAHWYYANMLQTSADKASDKNEKSRYEVMREHLKKCIELAPGYLNAYDMLGYVALLLQDELRETQTLLTKLLNSSPGRREIRMRVAELMVANKEAQAARVILQPLKEGEDDSTRQRARLLLDEIEAYLDNDRAIRQYEERRREAEAAIVATNEPDKPAERDEPAAPAARIDGPPTLTRSGRSVSSTEPTIETAKPVIKRPAGQQLEGALVSVDCSRGLTLRVRVGNGNVELHSDDPSKIEFLSYTSKVSNSFACGSFSTAVPVLIVYRRGADPRYLGEPLRVEFTEK